MDLPDYLPISMLNQLEYCERRFWLMYVCGEMEVNAPVLEGILQHERATSPSRHCWAWARCAGAELLRQSGAFVEWPGSTVTASG